MTARSSTRSLSSLSLIDVHLHVLLPEYEQALIRSGAGDPSRPFRRHDGPDVTCEKMAELGIAAALVNPLSVAGVHHGDDANARYLTRSVNEGLAKFSSGAPDRIVIFDSPPALAASPAAELAKQVGQALVVVRADRTGQGAL